MKYLIHFLILGASIQLANAQEAAGILEGFVHKKETNEPLVMIELRFILPPSVIWLFHS